jgi:hypothetical protein
LVYIMHIHKWMIVIENIFLIRFREIAFLSKLMKYNNLGG